MRINASITWSVWERGAGRQQGAGGRLAATVAATELSSSCLLNLFVCDVETMQKNNSGSSSAATTVACNARRQQKCHLRCNLINCKFRNHPASSRAAQLSSTAAKIKQFEFHFGQLTMDTFTFMMCRRKSQKKRERVEKRLKGNAQKASGHKNRRPSSSQVTGN